jgi:hypothetical protein
MEPSSRRIDSPLYGALLVAAIYLLFAYGLFEFRHRDLSSFVVAGGANVDAKHVPRELTVFPNSAGYDGMAFFRLALNPFTRVETAYGITLDNPAYRQQRIGYPLIVWLLSFGGRPRLVIPLLILVNVLAAAAVAYAGGVLAKHVGVHALWGVLFALYPGFLMSLSRDTCEVVACAFALAGLAARRNVVAAVCLTLAVITRETTMVLVAAIAIEWLLRRARPLFVWAVPAATFVTWQVILRLQWGTWPMHSSPVIPFSEFAQHIAKALPRVTHVQRLDLAECAFLAVIAIITAIVMWSTSAPLSWRLAWVAHLGLASTLPHANWIEDWAYLRVLADLFVISAAVIVAGRYAVFRVISLVSTAWLWWYLMSNLLDLA